MKPGLKPPSKHFSKRALRCLSFLLAAFVASSFAGCKREVSPGPGVWAVVNGKEISRADVEKGYRSRLNPDGPPLSQEESLSLKLNVLDELITSEILLERANKMNLVASDAEVEDKFTESKSPYTEDEFERKLKDAGITVDDLKSDIRRQLSIQKLLNREVVAKISITDQDISDYYNKNRAQFNLTEPQYHIAQIVITSHPDPSVHNRKNDKAQNEAEAGRKAAMLEQRLAAGADFSQLAMDYSEDPSSVSGGDLGFQSESNFNKSDPVLKKTVLSLRPGEVSHAIPIHGGYIIVKLVAKEPAGQRQLSDPQVQEGIRDMLRNRKEQLLRTAYLMEARDESHVTNYLARQIIESSGKLPAEQ
ncbi:MAG TPA: SurA N-terminal domain-containing protein [Candidatus Acidoferrales bacterium]|nr:SurA N-terminal domain-containing protein [Candidatus Acidoferrales bacterium]